MPQIRLATWNVYKGIINNQPNGFPSSPEERMRAFTDDSLVNNINVVAFQEVPNSLLNSQNWGAFELYAQQKGFQVVTHANEYDPQAGLPAPANNSDCGYVYLLRGFVPLGGQFTTNFLSSKTFRVGVASGRPPVYLEATFSASGKAYYLMNWHNEADTAGAEAGVDALSVVLSQMHNRGDNLIVLGDMNVNATKFETMLPSFVRGVTDGLDHIGVNRGSIDLLPGNDFFSDHYAVRGIFTEP